MRLEGRRVWNSAEPAREGDGFVVLLDGRSLRLPGGAVLRIGTAALADAVAAEWRRAGGGAIGGSFGPDALGLTRLAGTLQERVAPDRSRAVAMLLGYVEGDLLCYRATHPAGLVALQQAEWQPWLDWCAGRHGATLVANAGVMPAAQPAAAMAALERAVRGQDDAALTGLGVLVPALGSLVLGLAVVDGALAAEAATRLALLDELHQAERWGADDGAVARQALLTHEVGEAARFVALCREGSVEPG